MIMTREQYHTPGLMDKFRAADREKWEYFFSCWREDVRAIVSGHRTEPTNLERVIEENKKLVAPEPRRLFTALEDCLIMEKRKFWSAKQIARVLVNRTPETIAQRLYQLGLAGPR